MSGTCAISIKGCQELTSSITPAIIFTLRFRYRKPVSHIVAISMFDCRAPENTAILYRAFLCHDGQPNAAITRSVWKPLFRLNKTTTIVKHARKHQFPRFERASPRPDRVLVRKCCHEERIASLLLDFGAKMHFTMLVCSSRQSFRMNNANKITSPC